MSTEISWSGSMSQMQDKGGLAYRCDAPVALTYVRAHLSSYYANARRLAFCGDFGHLLVGPDSRVVSEVRYDGGEVALVASLYGEKFRPFRVEPATVSRDELTCRRRIVGGDTDTDLSDVEWWALEGAEGILVPVITTPLTESGYAVIAPAAHNLPFDKFTQALEAWLAAHPEFASR